MKHIAHASQPHTLPSRSKSQPHDQNLSKSVSVPTHGRQENAINFKDKKMDYNERQCTTSGMHKRKKDNAIHRNENEKRLYCIMRKQ